MVDHLHHLHRSNRVMVGVEEVAVAVVD